jgi:tetraacyldisaccharide 4'-kinase
LNILVVDSDKKFSNGHVLPLGALREPIHEIKRADKIVVVNKNYDIENAEKYVKELKEKYKKPVFLCNMKPKEVYNINSYTNLEKGADIVAFSAIAQPEQFYNLLKDDYNLKDTKSYPDHHIYTEKDMEELLMLQEKNDAVLVTTEKDAVKIYGYDIFALKLKPEIDLKGLSYD